MVPLQSVWVARGLGGPDASRVFPSPATELDVHTYCPVPCTLVCARLRALGGAHSGPARAGRRKPPGCESCTWEPHERRCGAEVPAGGGGRGAMLGSFGRGAAPGEGGAGPGAARSRSLGGSATWCRAARTAPGGVRPSLRAPCWGGCCRLGGFLFFSFLFLFLSIYLFIYFIFSFCFLVAGGPQENGPFPASSNLPSKLWRFSTSDKLGQACSTPRWGRWGYMARRIPCILRT